MHRTAELFEWTRPLPRALTLSEAVLLLPLPLPEAGALRARNSCERQDILGNLILNQINRVMLLSDSLNAYIIEEKERVREKQICSIAPSNFLSTDCARLRTAEPTAHLTHTRHRPWPIWKKSWFCLSHLSITLVGTIPFRTVT